MKNKKQLPEASLILIAGIVFLAGFFQDVYAAGELTVTNTYRLTPPAYEMSNAWKGSRRPINKNNTKILLHESFSGGGILANWIHPDYPSNPGRGTLVGDIAALKNCYTLYGDGAHDTEWLACYLNNTVPLNNDYLKPQGGLTACTYTYVGVEKGCLNEPTAAGLQWSELIGEENIVYGIYPSKDKIIKIDVTTGNIYQVGTYPTVAGNLEGLWGWVYSGYPVVDGFDVGAGAVIIDHNFDDGGDAYLMRVSDGVVSSVVNTEGGRRGDPNKAKYWLAANMHRAYSPDGKNYFRYSGSAWQAGVNNNDCTNITAAPCNSYTGDTGTPYDWGDSNNTYIPPHGSWFSSNDWYVVGGGVPFGSNGNVPYIITQTIGQVMFDREYAETNCKRSGWNSNPPFPLGSSPNRNANYQWQTSNACTGVFTHNPLITYENAGFWWQQHSAQKNYGGFPSPTTNKAGTMLVFPATSIRTGASEGKYSVTDLLCTSGNAPYGCHKGTTADQTYLNETLYPDMGAEVAANWGTSGIFLADLSTGGNPADVDGIGGVNIKDIQACIKVITNSQTNQTIIDNCKKLVSDTPVNVMNIKDIQVIIKNIFEN